MMCNFTEKIMIINLLIFLNFSPCWHIINSAPKFYKVLQKHCTKKQTRHQLNPEPILNLKPQKIWVQNVLAIITYPTRVVCIVQGPPIGKNALPVKQEASCLFTSGLTGSKQKYRNNSAMQINICFLYIFSRLPVASGNLISTSPGIHIY